LLNIGDKVFKIIKRIMHYTYQIEYLNDSQYEFTPQKQDRFGYGGEAIYKTRIGKR
jgi:hypothetical protein